MTKRFFFILTMMMISITTLSAQSIIGKWYADDEFIRKLELNDKDGKVDIVLSIKENTISTDILMRVDDNDDKIDMIYSVPGTYTKTGNKVTAKFDVPKAELKVTDIKTSDPEMSEMMKTEEGKKTVLKLVNTMMNAEVGDSMKDMAEITKLFNSFNVKSVNANTLSIVIGDENSDTMVINFKRK